MPKGIQKTAKTVVKQEHYKINHQVSDTGYILTRVYTSNTLFHSVVRDTGMPTAGAIAYTPLVGPSRFHLTQSDRFCIPGDYGEGEQSKAGSKDTDLQCGVTKSSPGQRCHDTAREKTQ